MSVVVTVEAPEGTQPPPLVGEVAAWS
jgi:hypothetical protein